MRCCLGQGVYQEAERLFRQVLAIFEKVHGSNHPHVAAALGSLSGSLEKQVRKPAFPEHYLCEVDGFTRASALQHGPERLM